MENSRPSPRLREGVVLKDRMNKTRVVAVTRLYRDPQFDKVIKRRVQYAVHDEKNESHTGDRVRIVETRALSKTKRWRMIKLVEKAKL
ncbi:MAG: 30S ribosomal protein S17 [Candidatus Omnitrophica bacterium]|nr:30S ribosomal protein S17 [Candidatus Omnitrophota bacterium]